MKPRRPVLCTRHAKEVHAHPMTPTDRDWLTRHVASLCPDCKEETP